MSYMIVKSQFEGEGFRAVRFEAPDMEAIAVVATAAMQERIGSGTNVQGVQAAPLSRRYAREKAKLGLPPIRDWHLTGETMARLGVQDVRDGAVTVGIDGQGSAKLIRLARWNSQYDQMVGLSDADQAVVLAAQEQIYAEKHEGRMK